MKSEREEFCKRVGQEEIDRKKLMKKNLPEKFIKLKNMVKERKSNDILEVYNMAGELIKLCEKKYGEDLDRIERMSESRIEEIYQLVSKFTWEIEDIEKELEEK